MQPAIAERRLSPATDPRRPLSATRLLHVEGNATHDTTVPELPVLLEAGDLLVLNDAATLPASLMGRVERSSAPIEARLATVGRTEEDFPERAWVVLFGEGDWRADTDARPPPPPVRPGEILAFGDLRAEVVAPSSLSPRLVEIRFDRTGDALAGALYAHGAPVQYRHLQAPLRLTEVQTPFATRPWAMEMPSTGRPLSWPVVDTLEHAGVEHAFVTHAAGLSATGDAHLDARLPLPERYLVPDATVQRIEATRRRGGRVIAAGTTVVRALESARAPGFGVATLRIDRHHRLRVVDGILTGVHSPGESHFALLEAFAAPRVLARAHRTAVELGYLAHELGDLMLVTLPRARRRRSGPDPFRARTPRPRP